VRHCAVVACNQEVGVVRLCVVTCQPQGNMGPRAKRMAKYDKQRIVFGAYT
jgi:hypothetical protein